MYEVDLCVARARQHNTKDLAVLQKDAETFVRSLETNMPCKNELTGLSSHATIKMHSVLECAEMTACVGICDNLSTSESPCELAHKPNAKRKGRLTNNKRKFIGLSLMKANRRMTVARRLCQTLAVTRDVPVWKDAATSANIAPDRYYVATKLPKGCAAMAYGAANKLHAVCCQLQHHIQRAVVPAWRRGWTAGLGCTSSNLFGRGRTVGCDWVRPC